MGKMEANRKKKPGAGNVERKHSYAKCVAFTLMDHPHDHHRFHNGQPSSNPSPEKKNGQPFKHNDIVRCALRSVTRMEIKVVVFMK